MSINPSKADDGNSNTTETFVTSFVTNLALLAVQVGAFLILKQRLGRIYAPRTYLPPPDKRASALPTGPWKWVPAVLITNPLEIIHKNGLDAYMFLRFLKTMSLIFLVFTLITWPTLLPVNSVNIDGSTRTGLDRFSWGDISSSDEQRYAAHIVIVYLLTFFVIFMARHELLHFLHMRQQFLLSTAHARSARARTVLVTALPPDLESEHDLREFASFVPGGVGGVWIYRDTKDVNSLFKDRQKACKTLEGAISSLLRSATKNWEARQAAHAREVKARRQDDEKQARKDHSQTRLRESSGADPENLNDETSLDPSPLCPQPASKAWLEDLVPEERRPKHHVGPLAAVGIGKRVDTIGWATDEIARLNKEIKEGRTHLQNRKPLGSAFVECNLQIGAHVLAQCLSYHEPLYMSDKWIEVSPKDVIWDNLDDSAIEMRSRYITSWIATIALIVGWAFPVAFIGMLSNVDDLCHQLSWLAWICKAPSPVPGIIQGVLPPVFLALLMLLLPFVLRALGWYENIPLYSLLSVSVYKRYYAFLVLNGFLIVTLTSGITAAIYEILQTPTKAVEQLAQRLPDASIFFLTYMATQGLAGAASALIQLVRLILHFVQKWLLGRTPRQAYKVSFLMPSANFGVVLPRLSLLATIGFAYSVISPVINGLATVSFFLFFIAWKFLLTQVMDQPEEAETGGLYFPLAISNLFVGLYIEQICLICLFALDISSRPKSAIPQTVVMVLLLVLTAAAHLFIRRSFQPMIDYLPMSLATKDMAKRYRRHDKSRPRLPAAIGPFGEVGKVEEEVVDLFSRDRLTSIVRHRLKLDPAKPEQTDRRGNEAKQERSDNKKEQGDGGDEEGQSTQVSGSTMSNGNGTSAAGATRSMVSPALRRQSSRSSQQPHAPGTTTAAVPGTGNSEPDSLPFTGVDPPADALRDSDEEDLDEELTEHAFDHPSTYIGQAWVWIPKDTLGFSETVIADLKAAGVDASDLGAVMDDRGTVEVTRNPPDEEWHGGHDR